MIAPVALLSGGILSVIVFMSLFGYMGEAGSDLRWKAIGWHGVLMTLGFAGLMPFGRWTYHFGTAPKQEKRKVHFVAMALATLAVLGGFIGVFWAHWIMQRFFGYDFADGKFSAPGGKNSRYVHIYLGWLVTFGVFAQAFMGRRKRAALEDENAPERIFTFHGSLGKVLIAAGCVNIMIATWFWGGWSNNLKIVIFVLTCVCLVFGVFPSPADKAEDKQSSELAPMAVEG